MLKHTGKHSALTLAWTAPLALLATLHTQGVLAADAPAMPGMPAGIPGGMPPGGMPPGGPAGPEGFAAGAGGMVMPSAHGTAAVYVKNGVRVNANEYSKNEVTMSTAKGAAGATGSRAEGMLLTSMDYAANGLVLNGGAYQFGGAKDYYTVYTNLANDYIGSSVAAGSNKPGQTQLGRYNSVLLFGLNTQIPAGTPNGSSGVDVAGAGTLNIDNVYLQVDGAQRYVTATYDTSKLIVNDSYFVSTGNANKLTNAINGPFSNPALFISGVARNNFSVNASDTYYFNSTVITEGWAALSTDASQGDGLDLYAYNTHAKALNGGYGTYADFGCRVWLYGSRLESPEVGMIIAKSGKITVQDGASAEASITRYNKGKSTKAGSVVTGGRNALMIHAPDMVGGGITQVDYGYFSARNSTLETSKKLVTKFDYSTYGAAAKQYVDFISGDVILVKSTSASIDLDNVKLNAYNGVLVHTVLNSDGWSNFLAAGDNQRTGTDGSLIVKPISLNLSNMSTSGAILHDDFHRNMEIKLAATTLTGKIVQGTFESWKSFWSSLDVSEANWLKDKTWNGSNTLTVSLDSKTRWTVTGDSSMTTLSIANGATLSAPTGQRLVMTVNGVETAIAPGTYNGKIVITPKTI